MRGLCPPDPTAVRIDGGPPRRPSVCFARRRVPHRSRGQRPQMSQDAEPNGGSSWQRRAVDRSLGTARARAVSRSGQILAAARELTEETGGLDFTVQDIVDRSGLSLRSFYKHFSGKDELLLALLEELLLEFAADLRRDVELHDDPVDRL